MSQTPWIDKVIRYYDATRFDYNVAWLNDENQAVHFGFYDERAGKHTEALLNTNRHLADRAQIQAGDRVLDAGCGNGGSSIWLAENRQAEVVGVTPVQSQVESCLQNALRIAEEKRPTFIQADYCKLPLPDQSFDVVWACESLCHSPTKERFYQEAYRVLKPGGRIVLAEYLRTARPLPEAEEAVLHNWLSGWAIPDICMPQEHRHMAKQAGFTSLIISDYTPLARVSLRNLYRHATRWKTVGQILKLVRIRSNIQHANHLAGIYQYEALQAGSWVYGVMLGRKS